MSARLCIKVILTFSFLPPFYIYERTTSSICIVPNCYLSCPLHCLNLQEHRSAQTHHLPSRIFHYPIPKAQSSKLIPLPIFHPVKWGVALRCVAPQNTKYACVSGKVVAGSAVHSSPSASTLWKTNTRHQPLQSEFTSLTST